MDRTRRAVFQKKPYRPAQNKDEPAWLQKCELSFLRTGKLNLSTIPLPDLTAIRTRSSMKELNISKCKLESLEGLAYQPNLSVFNADNSLLASFKNFKSVAHASIYCLKNTPMARQQNYLIGLLIMTEAEKPIVDGKLVAPVWMRRAKTYHPCVRELLNCGWPLEFPCPKRAEIRELCKDYNVTYVEDEEWGQDEDEEEIEGPTIPTEIDNDYGTQIEEPAPEDLTYLEMIDKLMELHNQVINNATRQFELLDESEERFQQEVKEMLEKRRHYVFDEEGDLDAQIVAAVRALCVHREE